MSLQSPRARQAPRENRADLWPVNCSACGGVMRLVMASPVGKVGPDRSRVFACEYLCDCGYPRTIHRCTTGEIVDAY
jgi:hypothetical protein